MRARHFRFAVTLALALTAPSSARSQTSEPLVLKAQGSFFIGGESKPVSRPALGRIPAEKGDITVNQMYVQYQIPMRGMEHVPVVMIHGCCLSAKTWETTPDGRAGWSEHFVRKDRSVYLPDQVSRGRSGFDPTAFIEVSVGEAPIAKMPHIASATHQAAWAVFRFGPKFGQAFPDEQFPIAAVDELYKQMIPDLNAMFPDTANPTWTQLAVLARKLKGAVLMGHSESGLFPEHAALIDPTGVKGIITIEMYCDTKFTPGQIAVLAKIPTLIMFGDHLGDVRESFGDWSGALATCNTFVKQLKDAGGDAQVMHLPALGIKGNSHMLMQDKNSDQLADLVIKWIDRHVEGKGLGRPR